jgi:hypothetical protein
MEFAAAAASSIGTDDQAFDHHGRPESAAVPAASLDEDNCLKYQWTRSQPIRTAAEIPLSCSLLETRPIFAYQRIASDALRLSRLGMSASLIARRLGVTDKTVAKAICRSRSGT